MTQKFLYLLLIAGAVACSSSKSTTAQNEPTPGKGMLATSTETPLGRDESVLVETTATVEKIDYETRQVMLRTAKNETISFFANPEVKRLNEIKVGDTVAATYHATLSFEVRPPTADELANPTSEVIIGSRNAKSEVPGAAITKGTRKIVTITALNNAAKTVTVKDPAGRLYTVQAKNEERFNKLKVGNTVAVTLTEGVNISIVR